MSAKSDEFEVLISRIHDLLEGDDATVKWNERIPDPDNPDQGRQIDVLVKKGGLTNLIECRLRNRPQDVQWIEELIGRRLSLDANAIIAVSSSGFTSGAIKKADTYGVLIRDIGHLSDEEIRAWSRSIELSVFYYRYEDFKLSLAFDQDDIRNINLEELSPELECYVGYRSLFTAQLDLLDEQHLIQEENRHKHVNFKVNFVLEDFSLQGCDVKEIQAEGVAYLEEVKLCVPEVLAYGDPALRSSERSVFVQNYNLGETKVIHHNGHVSMSIDLSRMDVPDYWQFRYIEVSSDYENYMDLLEVVHPEKIIMKVDSISLSIYGIEH